MKIGIIYRKPFLTFGKANVETPLETDIKVPSLGRFFELPPYLSHLTMKVFFIHFLVLGSLYALFSSPLRANEIVVSCPQGQIPFNVELAQTPEERAQGLMNRQTLGADEGMLFLFPEPNAVTMWMKNTLLSLDMIFANKEGKILAIAEKTTPHSQDPIGPVENTTQVLELKGGIVQKNKISKNCSLVLKN